MNDKMKSFKAWKNYELPPLNYDGQFASDWLHREWVAFQAGYCAALSQQDSEPECTCPAKDMPFGRCCKAKLKNLEELSQDDQETMEAQDSEIKRLKLRVAELEDQVRTMHEQSITILGMQLKAVAERDKLKSECARNTENYLGWRRKLNEKPKVSVHDYTEYDIVKETTTKHVWLFVKPDDSYHYQFADETSTFHEEHYETIEECEVALLEYVSWIEGQHSNGKFI